MPRTARIERQPTKTLPDLTAGATISNGPDRDEFIFAVGQIDKADADVKAAQKARKALRNHLKLRGFDLEQMDAALRERDRTDGTTISNLKKFAEYCGFLNLPIGSQMQLFDKPGGNGHSVQSLLEKAFQDGRDRGLAGQFPDEQAYPPMEPAGQEHMRGWNEGQSVLHQKLGKLNEDRAAEEAKKQKPAKAEKAEDAKGETAESAAVH